ncbi:MAG: MATE family efflux transporter [Pseudomonadales bacterium]|nr:MATE family efflux transporter [Pseudomonadales bacterium]
MSRRGPVDASGPAPTAGNELRALFRLGWPMITAQLMVMATGFLDTAMAGNYGAVDLAGVSLGGAFMWPGFLLASGVTMALTPIVAQLRGEDALPQAGERIRQGLWLLLPLTLIVIVAMWNVGWVLRMSAFDPRVIAITSDYLRAAAWGLPALFLFALLRQTCEGLGHTLPAMWIAAAVVPVNGLLNYAFIFGHFGAPEMGGVGAGWATAMVFWLELGLMILVTRQPWFRATTAFNRFTLPDIHEIARLLRIGLPIGIMLFAEAGFFNLIHFLVGLIGVTALAANAVAGNLNWMTFVMPSALGTAASIRVGYFVGAGDIAMARFAALTAYRFSFVYALVVGALLLLARHHLVALYTADPEVAALAASVVVFIAVYQLADDTQAVAAGTLRGYKDTHVPVMIGIIGYWVIALPVGAVLANGWLGATALGIHGYWSGMTVGLTVVALALGIRLVRTSADTERISAFARR